jgi:hypothetical protein
MGEMTMDDNAVAVARRGTGRLAAGLAATVLLGLSALGCAAGGPVDADAGGGPATAPGTAPGPTVVRPAGPAAALAGPLTAGKGILLPAAGTGPALAQAGYTESEHTASGTAASYTAPAGLPADGTYRLEPGPTADYVTRIVVRRPSDPKAFNGMVALEWLNISGGVDAAPDWTYLAPELVRKGYAWVGVSAQRIGVEGGAVAVKAPAAEAMGAGKGLKALDPERYASLSHPGDAFSYDIYTQVARALRGPNAEPGPNPLAGLDVRQVVAVGESQSAFMLTTYYDGVQPLTQAFDGFLIHSRAGSPAPLGAAGAGIDVAQSLSGAPTRLRTDEAVPAVVVQTETDVLGIMGYLPARQPDADHIRVWEVAGTAHADKVQVGAREDTLGCPAPVNRGQQTFVLRAALRHLQAWIAGGLPAPHGEPLQVDTTAVPPVFGHDDVGNVKGGVRTPVVDAPVDVLSGLPSAGSSIICLLFGSTVPLPTDVLAARYPSRDAYLDRYRAAAEAAIAAGFALPEDRAELLAGADPARLPG